MKKTVGIVSLFTLILLLSFFSLAIAEEENCIMCHQDINPGLVKDWNSSKHSKIGVTCSVCHGTKHTGQHDANLAQLPDEKLCATCHKEQFDEFARGKHNFGWISMNALPSAKWDA
jgi:hydroxylamine dehydrogenase